jgi:hypothetical protein
VQNLLASEGGCAVWKNVVNNKGKPPNQPNTAEASRSSRRRKRQEKAREVQRKKSREGRTGGRGGAGAPTGGPPGGPGPPPFPGDEGLEGPSWVYDIPDEEELFGPEAVQEAIEDPLSRPIFRIALGNREFFLKPSDNATGQTANEVTVSTIGRLVGLRYWPNVRGFPDPDDPSLSRVVQNLVPGHPLPEEDEDIKDVLRELDPRSVADTLLLEFLVLAGDRGDDNYRVVGDRLIGVDYQGSFNPWWPIRYGVIWRNLPEHLLQTPLNRRMLRSILNRREEILALVEEQAAPYYDPEEGMSPPEETLAAVRVRFDILAHLSARETPTVGDLRQVHPDREGSDEG